jgi:hypothetical protein
MSRLIVGSKRYKTDIAGNPDEDLNGFTVYINTLPASLINMRTECYERYKLHTRVK